MNRRLVVMRHCKSSWQPDLASDLARPLNERGRRDAPRVAAELIARDWAPDAVYSSDSTRTTETWQLMAPVLGGAVPVSFSRGLYHAGLPQMRKSAEDWGDHLQTVLVLGHNPGWSEAVGILASRPVELTTGNAALLEGQGATWAEALAGKWTLTALVRPADLA